MHSAIRTQEINPARLTGLFHKPFTQRTTRGPRDVPMRGCTISLDCRNVIERGRVVDPQMQVARIAR